MKTKKIILFALLLLAGIASAQITPSMTIPNPLPNYDGTYDDFGTNHLYYPNDGEIRYNNTDQTNAKDVVKFYTINTFPKKYLLKNNNIAYVHHKIKTNTSSINDSLHRIDLEWLGSSAAASLARVDTQNFAKLNYFTQWFGSAGRTEVKGGAAIACQSIYQNIDLVYTSNNCGLVMYFIIYPGGNYKSIRMKVAGSKANSIVSNRLKIESNWDYSSLERPQMYQYSLVSGTVTPIIVGTADWQGIGSNTYQFNSISSYNTSLPLIIQIKQAPAAMAATPGLKWSTYFGGDEMDFLIKSHCDANDNLYVAGCSNSSSFPQAQGGQIIVNTNNNLEGLIAKFNTTGVLQWTTFMGGAGPEFIHDMDFYGGDVFCVGKTNSNNLPCKHKPGASTDSIFGGPPQNGTGWDGYILQFGPSPSNGAMQKKWLTYYGGNNHDELNGIKFDNSGNMFVVGMSASTDLPPFGPTGSYTQTFNSSQLSQGGQYIQSDGFIGKFNASTSLNSWRTFYGSDALGTNSNTHTADYLYGVDIKGNYLYVCGKAGGTNLPNSSNSKIVNNDFDGIIARFTTNGAMSLGDAKYTDGNICNYSIKVRGDSVYAVGEAGNNLVPTNSGFCYYNGTYGGGLDGCFSIHPLNFSSTIHNSYLGGNGKDAAYDIQIAPNGRIYISGGTSSTNFPTNNLSGPYNSTGNPAFPNWKNDNFISCLRLGWTSLAWSTYLGSPEEESNWFPIWIGTGNYPSVTTMAVTSASGLYVTGVSNSTNTFPLDAWNGFPTYYQPQNNQGIYTGPDGTITRIDMGALGENTGLNDFKGTEVLFGFYPNPVSNTLFITNKSVIMDDLRYGVYDMSGRKLQEGNLKAYSKMEIDVSTLPEGVYVINVTNGKITYSNKFIKTGE